jgi:hypothetical protein
MIFKTINPKTLAEKKDIHLKILNTTDNAYNFEYGYVGEANKQKGTCQKTGLKECCLPCLQNC